MPSVSYQRSVGLSVYHPIVPTQWLGKYVPATTEELLEESFSMRAVYYQMKVDD
jgi:hypothetical protein